MKNVVKWICGMFLSTGLYITANAQTTDSMSAPAEDAIVCRQVAENVFDCYVEENNQQDNELYYKNEDDNTHQQDNKEQYRDLNGNKKRPNKDTLDWNRSQNGKRDSIDNSIDVYNEKQNRKPGLNTNPDNIHMNGDHTDYDKMYEYDHNKKKEGDPDNTDQMYSKENNEIQASK